MTNERKVQKKTGKCSEIHKKVSFNYSHSMCILLLHLFLVKTAIFVESLKVFAKETHKRAVNQKHTATKCIRPIKYSTTFVHPLYSNYACANKLHETMKMPRENILFGMAATVKEKREKTRNFSM